MFQNVSRVVWMKNGTCPIEAAVLELLPDGKARIRTFHALGRNVKTCCDRVVKQSSLRHDA